MCGINGIISKKRICNIGDRILAMNRSLGHRGPDAQLTKILPDQNKAFGHARLAIIDLDVRSNQPMEDDTCNGIIVFNGEIYNYKELKRQLHYNFETSSDTEVLLAGIKETGIDFINKCNGMFSFAFYDRNEDKLHLVRDRFGIKPLYYYYDKNIFIFSSEIKGILNSGLVKAEFNESAVDEYLGNRYIREPYTFFKNIYQLPSGSRLTLDTNFNVNCKNYWELPKEFNIAPRYNEEEIYEKFKAQVISAIKKRMVSDVPLGSYLSGGIDSSLISAIIALNQDGPVNTYTIGFEELNEFKYANKVSQKYNTCHHEIQMTYADYFNVMKELICYKDSPLGVPNEVPLAIMSKELKKKITVVLSGEGADELMGGYGKIYRSAFDFQNMKPETSFYNYFINEYEYVPRWFRDTYLNTDYKLRKVFDDKIIGGFADKKNEENIFRFFHTYHVKGLLQRVDVTTMYASVEARVPYLDHELVEFCYKEVPYDLKLKWVDKNMAELAQKELAKHYSEIKDLPKYLLRKMGLEYLPREVVERKKMGFPVPLNMWIQPIQSMAKEILSNVKWIKPNQLETLISDCDFLNQSGQVLWMFINIELFRRQYFEKEWRY